MENFLGGDRKEEVLAAARQRAEADGTRWQALAEEFRAGAGQPKGEVPVTVSADLPLFPYGEEGGALRRFLRRCARRCVRWYVEPMVQQQNRVNRALRAEIRELRGRLEELEGK